VTCSNLQQKVLRVLSRQHFPEPFLYLSLRLLPFQTLLLFTIMSSPSDVNPNPLSARTAAPQKEGTLEDSTPPAERPLTLEDLPDDAMRLVLVKAADTEPSKVRKV
jgi:hypothetical protein